MSDDWRNERLDGMHERRAVDWEDPIDRMERREAEAYFETGQHLRFWPPITGPIRFFVSLLLAVMLFALIFG